MSFIQRSISVGTGGLATSDVLPIGVVDVAMVGADGSRLLVGDVIYNCPVDFSLDIKGTGEVDLTWLGDDTIPEGTYVLLIASAELSATAKGGGNGGGGGGSGDASAAKQDQQSALLTAIRNILQSNTDIANLVLTDDNDNYFVRRETSDEGVVSVAFFTMSGSPYTPGSNIRPAVNGVDVDPIQNLWQVTTAGTGYSVGNTLAQLVMVQSNGSVSVSASGWINLDTGAVVVPNTDHLIRIESNNTGIINKLDEVVSAVEELTSTQGDKATAARQDTLNERIGESNAAAGNTSVMALLRSLKDMWTTWMADTSAAIIDVTRVGGTIISKTVGLFVTDTVYVPWFKKVTSTGELIASGDRTLNSYYIANPHATDTCYVRFFNAATKEAVNLSSNPTSGQVYPLGPGDIANMPKLNANFPLGLVVYVTKDETGSVAPSSLPFINVTYR